MIKVKLKKDLRGRWYLLPDEDSIVYEFIILVSNEMDSEELSLSFEKKFSKYLTGRSINSKQLYADI